MNSYEKLLPTETQLPTEVPEELQEPILLSPGVRIFGLALMTITVALALLLAGWVFWNRKSPVITRMQPIFLFMLCIGVSIEVLSLMPAGANDENTENIDAACVSYWWFLTIGGTFVQSALFSKLWRVNQIFHAKGFQRKVVTVRDVLRPFLILLGLNLTFLLILTFVDPPVWQSDLDNTFGYCAPEGVVGIFVFLLIVLTSFGGLVFLCIQAYRARDIDSEFSEARGVALALFSNLQAALITLPTSFLIYPANVDAKHILLAMQVFVSGMSMLLFIFSPLIAHQRQHAYQGSSTNSTSNTRTHISGLDFGTARTSPGTASCPPAVTSPTEHTLSCNDEENHAIITSLEMEVETLRSQLQQLESKPEDSP